MSATQWAVIGVSVLALAFAVVVGWLLWSSRLSQGGDSAETRYRRNYMDLHSTRNRRSMRGSRRNMWAAGSVGAVGAGYIGSGGSDHDGGGSDHGGGGCGGGGCGGGGGGGCGGGGGS